MPPFQQMEMVVTVTLEPQTSSTGIVLTACEWFAQYDAEVADLDELIRRLGRSRELALKSGWDHEAPEIDEESAAVKEALKNAKAQQRHWQVVVSLEAFVERNSGMIYSLEAWRDEAALWLTRDTGKLAEARRSRDGIRAAERQLTIGCFDDAALNAAVRSVAVLEKALFAQAKDALMYLVDTGRCTFVDNVVVHLR
jgi:hypothetical protein